MAHDAIRRRIDALEQRTGEHAAVYGVQFPDTGLVEVCGTEERLPAAEFEQRYPHGTIIKVVYQEVWEAI
jgi:hypothetical protein